MKLNLPSAWTSQKMNALFLMTMINYLSKTESGQEFYQCLGTSQAQGTDQYTTIINFANNIADKEIFCCNSGSGPWACSPLSPACPYPNHIQGQCVKTGQSKFCITQGLDWGTLTVNLPGNLCGGVLGNSLPNNITVGTCPDLNIIDKSLIKTSTAPTFSWLCCDNNTCNVPINVAVNGTLAFTNCVAGQYSMMCFQDNGGWSCTGSIASSISDITQPMGDCVLQVVPNSAVSSLPLSSSLVTSSIRTDEITLPISPIVTSGTSNTFSPNKPQVTDNNDNSSNPLSKSDIIAIIFGTLSLVATAIGLFFGWKKYNAELRKRDVVINNLATELRTLSPRSTTVGDSENSSSLFVNRWVKTQQIN